MRILDQKHIDKTKFEIVDADSQKREDAWEEKTLLERLEGLEILRQMWHEYDPDTERLPRLYSIIKRSRR